MHIVAAEGDLVTQREEHFLNLCVLQTFAETAGQPVEVNVDLGALELLGIVVDEARDLHLGIEVAEELHRQVKRLVAALGVDGLFVAGGRLGAVVVAQRRAADAVGLEVGDLEDDLVRVGQDGILRAAHDARETDGTLVIGDDEIVGVQGQLLAVEELERLILLGAADDDVAGDVVGIVCVGGLAGGEHDVVRHVDKRVDRAHANFPDAALHPVGGGLDVQPLDLRAGHAGAALLVEYGDMEAGGVLDVAVEVLEGLERQVVQRRQLTGDAVVAPQVRAVRHGLVVDLEEDIVHSERRGERRTGRCVEVAQIEDDGFLCGEEVGKADLARGADHAVARDAAQLRLLDLDGLALTVPAAHGTGAGHGDLHSVAQVHAAADDLADVAAADVGPADLQLVGVRVLANLLHHADDHMVEAAGQILGVLHLDGGHRQVIGQTLEVHILRQVHIVPDPVQ